LLVDTLKDVTVIPDNAVQRGPNGLYAFVVSDDSKVAVQAIKVGQSNDGESVVEQGLTPGQRVVVAGQYRLMIGSVVQPTEAPPPSTPGKEAENSPPKAP
jgi:multidrug efflux system membrane fusion protein